MSAVLNYERVHIRFEGRSLDRSAQELGIVGSMSDEQIRQRIANDLDVSLAALSNYAVDRNSESASLTIRPEAVYG